MGDTTFYYVDNDRADNTGDGLTIGAAWKDLDYANDNGATTIALTGHDGGKLLKSAKENIHVPCYDMQRVEDIHLLVEHLLTSLIREEQKTKMMD